MNAYAILCHECSNKFPAVLDCPNCQGYGRIVIKEPDKKRWPRWAAWGTLALVAIGALLWGWLSR